MLNALIVFIAVEHLFFLVLEMFLWRRPLGLKVFRMSQTVADQSATLAANQGLYNGFLAAGLIWSVTADAPEQARSLKIFFLGCVVVAGAFGALTVSKRILMLQAAPAAIALAWLLIS